MKKPAYFILLFSLLAGTFLAGTRFNQRSFAQHSHARKVLYYVDPMHTSYRSSQPGIAPDCGMKLVAVYADEAPQPSTAPNGSVSAPAGAVAISAQQQQLFGVRVSEVEKSSGAHTLRLFGRVVPDEARVYKLSAGIDGFIQEVFAPTTGSQVKKDQLLATLSAPNATSAIQTYILNSDTQQRLSKLAAESSVEGQSLPAANWNVQQRVQQLQNVGMSLLQIEEIRRTHQIPDRIKIVAPADGFVLARNVSPGQKFERGAEWYRIADLRRVWILADISEMDAQYVRPGMRAQVSLPNQGRSFAGRVADVLPQFDASTRTLKVRIEADNPSFVLRPDMFVDIEFPVQLPAAMTVPTDSIIDSGLKKTVFVEKGQGFFEPRTIETGWRLADKVEVVKGLSPGERIVVSGTFLVDSETRLKTGSAPTSVEKPQDRFVTPKAPEHQHVASNIDNRQVGR
jgi:membrane fusion protein, copper/silver efflux system